MTETVVAGRRVSIPLFIGIFLVPLIFVWFLLRKGYSVLARVLGFGWFALVILAVVSAPDSKAPSATQVGAANSPAASEQPRVIPAFTADQVVSAYSENTVAADMNYKGKTVKVSGSISDINTDFLGYPYLVLSTKNQFMGPQFKFDKNDLERLASLKKGEGIEVVCKGIGDVAKVPMFEDCVIVE